MKYFVIGAYVLLLVSIAYYSSKKTKNVDDFFLGGRTIGPWLSAFAYGTSYFSAVIFIGYAGKIGWNFGLSGLWIVLGNIIVGTMLAWMILAKPTRTITNRIGALTMPVFLEKRYDAPKMKVVSAIIIFVFMVPYSASVYMGLSYLFEQVFNIPFVYALLFIAVLTAVYLTLGGYFALTLTDLVQGIVMIFGVFVLLYYVGTSPQLGGSFASGIAKLKDINPSLTASVGPPGVLPLASLVILTSLGVWGLPQMTQKFYSIKDEKSVRPAMVVSTIFAGIIAFGAYFTGAFGRLFLDNTVPNIAGIANYDMVMPRMLVAAMPEWGVVLLLLLVLAASMSTLAALVLVASSAIAIDLVERTFFKEIEKGKVVVLMRVLCVVFIACSVLIALYPTAIINLMSISWGAMAGSFLAPYVYGLFSRRTTRAGAWAGLLTGLSIMCVGALIVGTKSPLIPTIGAAAIVLPLLVVPVVSYFSRPLSEEYLNKIYQDEEGQENDLEQKI
jgi:SSS family transporter